MSPDRAQQRWLWWIVPLAALALLVGWQTFWFLCDDAFISFRYIDNRHHGWGYVWNPPPFLPVEGYTSLLWLLLLDAVWTLLGIPPDRSAAALGLIASAGTVAITLSMLWRVPVPEQLAGHRGPLAALGLLGVLSNKSFLTWTSSGLETPLFVMLLVAWCHWGALSERHRLWPVLGGAVATLLALCRPDGLLYLAATPVVIAADRVPRQRLTRSDLAAGLPMLAVVAHMLWRRATYGYWLPNTYYAKVGEPWFQGGGNHFWLFVLEYGLFWWLPLLGAVLWRHRAALRTRAPYEIRLPTLLTTTAVLAHGAYYVLRVGGDHFEHRIFVHSIPLLFVLTVFGLGRLGLRARRALPALALLVCATWVISWPDWLQMRDITTEDGVKKLRLPVMHKLPRVFWPWARQHDLLEDWCVRHLLATSHQTHKWFRVHFAESLPPRSQALAKLDASAWEPGATGARAFPVQLQFSVGVSGWVLPYVAVLDRFGLNDLVIARTPPPRSRFRFAAHDRWPPDGYIECFRPSVKTAGAKLTFIKRTEPFDQQDIIDCEQEWLEWVKTAQPPEPEPEDGAADTEQVDTEPTVPEAP